MKEKTLERMLVRAVKNKGAPVCHLRPWISSISTERS